MNVCKIFESGGMGETKLFHLLATQTLERLVDDLLKLLVFSFDLRVFICIPTFQGYV